MNSGELDVAVRTAAFAFLVEQRQIYGDDLPWSILLTGFRHAGQRVPSAWLPARWDRG